MHRCIEVYIQKHNRDDKKKILGRERAVSEEKIADSQKQMARHGTPATPEQRETVWA